MRSRRIYAHWLDPDYLGRRVFSENTLKSRYAVFEGIMKRVALEGDCICISDVQLIESGLLLRLFADKEFRAFVTAHPGFLRLVARPTDQFGATWDRLKVVGSGMARAVDRDKYIPNTFDSDATVPHVAGMFKSLKSESDAQQFVGRNGKLKEFVDSYSGSDRVLLVGLSHALAHFLADERVSVLS